MSKNKNHRNPYNNVNMGVAPNVIEETVLTEPEMVEEVSKINIEPELVETENTVLDEYPDVTVEPVETVETVEEHDVVIHTVEKCDDEVCDVTESKFTVATGLVDGSFIGRKTATDDLDSACKIANEQTKLTGEIHSVFNSDGFVVFTAKKKLVLLSYKKRGNKNVNWYT